METKGKLVQRLLRHNSTGTVLGKGSFGTVVLVRYLGKKYAVKTMSTRKYGSFFAAVREE